VYHRGTFPPFRTLSSCPTREGTRSKHPSGEWFLILLPIRAAGDHKVSSQVGKGFLIPDPCFMGPWLCVPALQPVALVGAVRTCKEIIGGEGWGVTD